MLCSGMGAPLHNGKGRSTRNAVEVECAHRHGPGDLGHDAGDERGVDEVAANAAEQLLAHSDGKGTDDDHLPPLSRVGHVVSDEDTGDDSRKVADGDGALDRLLADEFGEQAGRDRRKDEHERLHAKRPPRAHHARGNECDDDVKHHFGGAAGVSDVRRSGNSERFDSLFFSLLTFSWSPGCTRPCPGRCFARGCAWPGRRRCSSRS